MTKVTEANGSFVLNHQVADCWACLVSQAPGSLIPGFAGKRSAKVVDYTLVDHLEHSKLSATVLKGALPICLNILVQSGWTGQFIMAMDQLDQLAMDQMDGSIYNGNDIDKTWGRFRYFSFSSCSPVKWLLLK